MKNRVLTLMLILASMLMTAIVSAQEADEGGASDTATAEERKATREAMRERFENMSEEERQAHRERVRSMSDEERQAMRERRSGMSEEKRAAMRERWENATEEEREAMRERRRQHHEHKGKHHDRGDGPKTSGDEEA